MKIIITKILNINKPIFFDKMLITIKFFVSYYYLLY